MTRTRARAAALVLVAALGVTHSAPPVAADWLSRLIVAGEKAASKGARSGAGLLDNAALHLKSLPPGLKGPALAAHVSQEGHWTFLNRAGERFTAATPDELARVTRVLAPDAAADAKLTLVLTEETAFRNADQIKALPRGADLRLAAGKESYPLLRAGEGGTERLMAEVRPRLVVPLADRRMFEEAVWQLARPLEKSRVRVLALEPGGPHTLASVPRIDKASGRAMTDGIDPFKLKDALAALKGQTAVVTGRIEGDLLVFASGGTGGRSLILKDLTRAAEAADVNLVVLANASARQPGARNWLWMRTAVSGLEEAVQHARFSDFLGALAGTDRRLVVSAREAGSGRIVLTALPEGARTGGTGAKVGEVLADLVSEVTGNVATSVVEAHMKDADRQQELDRRIIPFLPSALQLTYLGAMAFGLFGLPFARRWWLRLWPAEVRTEYASATGYHAARVVKFLTFLLVFLPLAGFPAAAANALAQLWAAITLPWRALRWLARRLRPQTT